MGQMESEKLMDSLRGICEGLKIKIEMTDCMRGIVYFSGVNTIFIHSSVSVADIKLAISALQSD